MNGKMESMSGGNGLTVDQYDADGFCTGRCRKFNRSGEAAGVPSFASDSTFGISF